VCIAYKKMQDTALHEHNLLKTLDIV